MAPGGRGARASCRMGTRTALCVWALWPPHPRLCPHRSDGALSGSPTLRYWSSWGPARGRCTACAAPAPPPPLSAPGSPDSEILTRQLCDPSEPSAAPASFPSATQPPVCPSEGVPHWGRRARSPQRRPGQAQAGPVRRRREEGRHRLAFFQEHPPPSPGSQGARWGWAGTSEPPPARGLGAFPVGRLAPLCLPLWLPQHPPNSLPFAFSTTPFHTPCPKGKF